MFYIFDMDGTLIDSMGAWSRQMLALLDSYHITYPDDIVSKVTPLGTPGVVEYFKKSGITITPEFVISEINRLVYNDYAYNIPEKSGACRFLNSIKKQGNSVNLLSASPHITVDVCLKRLKMFDIFDNVWTCDDFGFSKNDKQIYLSILNELCCNPSDCIFFDDNYYSLVTAKSVGLKTVGVYDKSSDNEIEKIKSVCDKYIMSFDELAV